MKCKHIKSLSGAGWCQAACMYCTHTQESACKQKVNSTTNADRIRSMSDEELARFLWEQNGGNRYWKSVEKYLDWLKQPAKEE